jgi:hypothetical protein
MAPAVLVAPIAFNATFAMAILNALVVMHSLTCSKVAALVLAAISQMLSLLVMPQLQTDSASPLTVPSHLQV